MKQLLLLIIGVLLAAFLAACGGQQETTPCFPMYRQEVMQSQSRRQWL
jgi:ABC-type uncharacterized transport system auxiliary subunit